MTDSALLSKLVVRQKIATFGCETLLGALDDKVLKRPSKFVHKPFFSVSIIIKNIITLGVIFTLLLNSRIV